MKQTRMVLGENLSIHAVDEPKKTIVFVTPQVWSEARFSG